MKNNYLFLILPVILLGACHSSGNPFLLDRAEQYARHYHDSASIMLDGISIERWDEEEMARYYLVRNLIERNKHSGKVCDSTLAVSEQFFRKVNDRERLAETWLLQGWNNYVGQKYPEAEKRFGQALDLSLSLNDSSKIIQAYREWSWMSYHIEKKDTACHLMERALSYCVGVSRLHHRLYLGDLYARNGEVTEAVACYRKAFADAAEMNSRHYFQTIRNNIMQVYTNNGMYQEAFLELDTFRRFRIAIYPGIPIRNYPDIL